MFLIVPLIIIFLSLAYIQVNSDIGIVSYIVIFFIIFFTLYISFKIYKALNHDIKQQEQNTLQLEINALKKRLRKEDDKKIIFSLNHKISVLEESIKSLSLK